MLGKDYTTMTAKVDNNIFNAANQYGIANYLVYTNEGKDLMNFWNKFGETRKIAFKVAERNNNGLFVATDIVDNETQMPVGKYYEKVLADEKEAAKKALEAKIAEAEAKVKDVKKSADGTDVLTTEKWALEADIDAINTAITAAKGELTKTTEEMNKAKETLQTAMDKFAPKAGTKTA